MQTENGTPAEGRSTEPGRRSECVTGTCPLGGRFGRVIWAIAIAALIYAQWPLLKGLFYKATGTAGQETSIPWRGDLPEALAEAQAADKPALIVFGASWCPPCIAMKHDVWPDPTVEAAVVDGYVPVYVDVDAPGSANTTARYGVGGIPAVLVVDANGEVTRRGGYMSRSQTIEFLAAGV